MGSTVWTKVWGGSNGDTYTKVTTYADLPDPTLVPDKIYIVLTATGIFPFNRKPAGMYHSNGVAWEYMSAYPDLVKDSNFGIVNTTDTTKVLQFNNADISTATTRIIKPSNYDQDMTNPIVDTEKYNTTLDNPAYQEGLVFYDKTKKALSYYNSDPDVTVTLGQEMLIPVWNNSGATITNGSAVYPISVFNGLPTIGLATAQDKDKCRLVGVVTHDIENNSMGFVAKV